MVLYTTCEGVERASAVDPRTPNCHWDPMLPALKPCSLCMMAAPPAKGAGTLQDWATRDKADAGMPSYFSAPGGERGIPPLADIPAELVSLVLHAGLAPRGAFGGRDGTQWEETTTAWIAAMVAAVVGLTACIPSEEPSSSSHMCCRSRRGVRPAHAAEKRPVERPCACWLMPWQLQCAMVPLFHS